MLIGTAVRHAGLRLVSASSASADCVSPQRTLECAIDGVRRADQRREPLVDKSAYMLHNCP